MLFASCRTAVERPMHGRGEKAAEVQEATCVTLKRHKELTCLQKDRIVLMD